MILCFCVPGSIAWDSTVKLMIDGSERHNCKLAIECQISCVIENHSNPEVVK